MRVEIRNVGGVLVHIELYGVCMYGYANANLDGT